MLSKDSGVMDLTEWLLINFEGRSNASDVDMAIDLIWEEKIDHDTFLTMSDDKIDEVFSNVSSETRKEFKTLTASENENNNIVNAKQQGRSELTHVSSREKEEVREEDHHESSAVLVNKKLSLDLDNLDELSDNSESSIICNAKENSNEASTRRKEIEDINQNKQVELDEDNHESSEASSNGRLSLGLDNLLYEFSDNSKEKITCKDEEENGKKTETRRNDEEEIDEKKQCSNQSESKDSRVRDGTENANQQKQQQHMKGGFAVEGIALSAPILLEGLLLASGAVLAGLAFAHGQKKDPKNNAS